ncbi:hypothetical protein [Micromonospora parathelypteridis]|uniref:Uncharacterized protein n=1 Tax=Micromonospora parathelypteridis TaxID=1839617 RepID=A0A840VUA1_9ACTN|nr:hypothetical protein [Micromonospora parathelypteridis]MBB5480197.1 hypothetical protein [Micromonospora parathelypteridis]GGO24499.1 hypothetical protein GCM10011576_46120 [Micromonospora parathelypteridis]
MPLTHRLEAIVVDETTRSPLRRAIGTPARRWLLAGTLLAGLLVAVALTAAAAPADRTFAALSDTVQSLMSVATPLFGVLLVRDLRRAADAVRVGPTVLAVCLPAAVIGVVGVLICATTLALTPADIADDPWRHAGTIAVGSVLVQIVAGLVGTGLGLLLRSAVVAFLATIVLPLGLFALLGGVDALRPAQAWLTPFGSVRNLLSGDMSVLRWAQWWCVLLIWGVGLNTAGAAVLKRRDRANGSTSTR